MVETVLKLYFLFGPKMGVLGFLYAILIGEVLSGAFFAVHVARAHGMKLVGRTFKPLLIRDPPRPRRARWLCLTRRTSCSSSASAPPT